jgi:soluble lytic murein transglycosylase-like protein
MDLNGEIARIQARISQIFGAGDDATEAAPQSQPRTGRFAAMVNQALDGGAQQTANASVAPEHIEDLVQSNAAYWQVDPALVRAVMVNESGFDANATSHAGAQGLMQLMPETASSLGVTNAYDPKQSVWGGARYLRGLMDRFGGDLTKVVAAYNAGPEAVDKYGGVPPFAETQNYVKNVLASYQEYKQRPQ